MDILRGYRFSCLEFKIRSLIFGLLAFVNIMHSIGAEDRRPNIVLILCDDHRYDAMGFMGHPFMFPQVTGMKHSDSKVELKRTCP